MDEERISYKELQKPFMAKMLTTLDNPYDPFDDYDNWNNFDTQHNYNTFALIARMIDERYDSRDFNVIERNDEINEIIDRIVQLDPLEQYVIIVREIVPQYME